MKQGVLLSNAELNEIINHVSFDRYLTSNCSYIEASVFKGVPINLLDIFRSKYTGTFRIKYRGSRRGSARTKTQRQATCLKSEATSFAAYYY